MNLTKYNPNNDRGITTQPNVSGLRCFDGEDLRKLVLIIHLPFSEYWLIKWARTLSVLRMQSLEVVLGCYRLYNVSLTEFIVKEQRERLQKQHQKEWILQQMNEKQAQKDQERFDKT